MKGYRRFAERQVLYVGPRVVAIVGPNEAGKTTLLAALRRVTNNVVFDRREFTGRQFPDTTVTVVSARYRVEDHDRQGLSEVLDANQNYTFERHIHSNGSTTWALDPWVHRDRAARKELCDEIQTANERGALVIEIPPAEGAEDSTEPVLDSTLADQAAALATALSDADEDLTEEQIEGVAALRLGCEGRGETCADPKVAQRSSDLAAEEEAIERSENPQLTVYAALAPRVPLFLEFDAEQRALRSDYVWADHDTAPAALGNLLSLADVTYDEYRQLATDRDRRDELSTVERALNSNLKKRLSVWSQHQLTVTLRADPESLAVLVTDENTQRDVPIEERSAGLQMFAALLAFCARYAEHVPPILLFDEAETHLHYGAQADLIHVFETQTVAQAVIYTTHSIGCLPEDLGRSIRVVAPTGDETSEIRNAFWSGGVGLTPLTLAMGASALAFSPARYAVIGEGATEAILLPSLFRATRDKSFAGRALGFQVAPGSAQVPHDDALELESEAGNVAYLFDADEGGRKHGAKLAERAHTEGRVFILGDGNEPGLCTEDLVAAEIYAAAVNQVLRDTRDTIEQIGAADLPAVDRPGYVAAWCSARGIASLSKALIAERVLSVADEAGELVDASRRDLLAKLYRDLRKALRIK